MRADELAHQFEKRRTQVGLRYQLGEPAPRALLGLEALRLPRGVARFYAACDGLVVESPALELYPLQRLELTTGARFVEFALVDGAHRLAFDSAQLNAAGEWDIVSADSKQVLTLTMASFWSDRLLKWIDHRLPIWIPSSPLPCS